MNAVRLQSRQAPGRAGPAHPPCGETGQRPASGGRSRRESRRDLETHGRGRDKGRARPRRRAQQDGPRARRARGRRKTARDRPGVGIGKARGLAHDGGEGAGANRLLQRQKNVGAAGQAHQHEITPGRSVKAKARRMRNARFHERELLRDPQKRAALPRAETVRRHQREARGGRSVGNRLRRDFEEGGAAAHAGARHRRLILQAIVCKGILACFDARDRFPQKTYLFRSAALRHRLAPK